MLLQKQAEQLKNSKQNVIDILGTVVEYRNLESGEHIKRVKSYTQILATQIMHDYLEYNLTKEKIDIIVSASALHDIGKIAIPDSILMKPGKLTPDEFDFMKSHTTRGCEILENIENAWDAEYGKISYEISAIIMKGTTEMVIQINSKKKKYQFQHKSFLLQMFTMH